MTLTLSDDPATARLGSYLAIAFGAQLVCHLLGVGVAGGEPRVEWLHPFLVAAAVGLACGVRQARTVLLVVHFSFFVLASFLVVIAFTTWSLVGLILSLLLLSVAAAQMVALAFTVPAAGTAGGVPEGWRPWATSEWLHLSLLLAGLVAAVTGA
ncbi:MAG: hypothetical protein M3Q48_00085 [Actinomycetota bacterium]|nr:hypothetical protein [Actinomycetota bacterium]